MGPGLQERAMSDTMQAGIGSTEASERMPIRPIKKGEANEIESREGQEYHCGVGKGGRYVP